LTLKVGFGLRNGKSDNKALQLAGDELKSRLRDIVEGGMFRSVMLERATESSSILVSATPSTLRISDTLSWRCSKLVTTSSASRSTQSLLSANTDRHLSLSKSSKDLYTEEEVYNSIPSHCDGGITGIFEAHQVIYC
jgi:hypothetical protein